MATPLSTKKAIGAATIMGDQLVSQLPDRRDGGWALKSFAQSSFLTKKQLTK